MENKNIYDDVNKKDMRKYLSSELHALQRRGIFGNLEYYEKQLKTATEQYAAAKKYSAIKEIIKDFKWDEYDVSDEIDDYNPESYFCFVGNEKEYDQLLKNMGFTS